MQSYAVTVATAELSQERTFRCCSFSARRRGKMTGANEIKKIKNKQTKKPNLKMKSFNG